MTERPSSPSHRPPGRGFRVLLLTEAKLSWREPFRPILGVGLPVLLMVIFGSVPAFREPIPSLGGLTLLSAYVPILIALTLAALALMGLPAVLATYRELGVLRRMSLTPMPPSWVLAAQLFINLILAAAGVVLILVIGVAGFGLHGPGQVPGFLVSVVLAAAALFALGLCVGAAARGAKAAGAIGSAVFVPLMFFAGLWIPREIMPTILRTVSDFTPLGAAVQALQEAMQGGFPPVRALLVMLAYAMAFWITAVKIFRWE